MCCYNTFSLLSLLLSLLYIVLFRIPTGYGIKTYISYLYYLYIIIKIKIIKSSCKIIQSFKPYSVMTANEIYGGLRA